MNNEKKEPKEKEKKIIPLKPHTPKQLAKIYGVSTKTLRKWLKELDKELGKRNGWYYSIPQVKIIFSELLLPSTNKELINSALKKLLKDEIDAEDLKETKKEYQPIIDKLLRQQAELAGMDSNSKLYTEFGFNVLRNIDKYYDSADLDAKQKLISLIFPEKMVFENNQFRTKRVNKAVELICRKVKELPENKNGLALNFENQSGMVAPRGLLKLFSNFTQFTPKPLKTLMFQRYFGKVSKKQNKNK